MSEQIYLTKAAEFIKKAEKKLKGGVFSGLFGSKAARAEEACEYYKNAANNYKLAKHWDQAAEAYKKCAYCEEMCKSGDEAEYYFEAGNMMKKINNAEAVNLYNTVVEAHCQAGKINQAARIKKQIAEIYEADFEYFLSIKHYKEAADLYQTEGNFQSEYHKCMLKAADLLISQTNKTTDQIIEAMKIYEEIANKYLEVSILRPNAKNLFFQVALLYLLIEDTIGCNQCLEKFADQEPSFQQTREYKFVVKLIKTIDNKNITEFSDACYELNQVYPLDKWKTNVLTGIKEKIETVNVEDNPYL